MAGRKVVGALVAGIAFAALPVTGASAAVVQGGGSDPAGDGAGAARDVVSVAASYDDAGSISFQIGLAEAPTAASDSQATAMIGTTQPDGACAAAGAVGGKVLAGPGVWIDGTDGGAGSHARDGATVTFSASAPQLALGPRDCALVNLVDASDPGIVFDVAGPFPLAPPPPPEPQPQPDPPARTAPVGRARAPARRARLALSATTGAKPLPRARWTRVTVVVRNRGTAPARRVALRVGAAPGVAIRPRRASARTLGPGRALRLRVALKATARAKATTRLSLRASGAPRLSARGTLTVRFATKTAPKPRPRPTRPGAGSGADDLAGRYFWRFNSRVDYAWDNDGIAFLPGGWAYRGLPRGGLPRCTRVTASGDGDGCVRYALHPRTGALTVGGEKGWWRRGDLKVGEHDDYRELQVPRPGSRYAVELIHRGFSGFCGLITGCTTWTEWLTLRADGNFALSSMSIGTMGGSGVPFTAGWSAQPDQYGRYEILSGARIRLAYADGSVVVKTIGIELRRGRPDPSREGLLLDDTNFYPEGD
ncbi:hypothetical protein [Conexibacter arvalis]|uniref:CARDB domain-containing protein n=1 Tax=Conexibacter arvalis TaxID=912552 RepID=A0A840IDA0_9ACTN|nr:hypothetical protein [Conexibacter arvalis]MBB4662325.1 hypothetical protein [Conexibacter arvalis]